MGPASWLGGAIAVEKLRANGCYIGMLAEEVDEFVQGAIR
jgi:hypothetical protein